MVIAALAMTALLLFAALAIDVGVVWSSRTQSQNADDSAALAAAAAMITQTGTNAAQADFTGARTAGKAFANKNATVGNPSVQVKDSDFVFGDWSLESRTFTPAAAEDPTKPEEITAVRVKVNMDDASGSNKRSPVFLSQLLGITGFTVRNTAIGYLGFQGKFAPSWFNLPIAVDSCELSDQNGNCGSDFCAKVESPTSCSLLAGDAQSDSVGLVCGVFQNTGDQNMCWTAFDGSSAAINKQKITDIVDNGNAGDVNAGDDVYLDNGDKTSSLAYIRDKMYGCGSFKQPADGQGPNPRYGGSYAADSWVVKLPVVECQDTTHCASGTAMEIKGGVCFEIREIVHPTPGKGCKAPSNGGDKIVKGRPLCPNSSNPTVRQLYDTYCRDKSPNAPPVEPGGCDYGPRANKVVLVQ